MNHSLNIFGVFDDIYSVSIVLGIYNFDVASTFFTDFYQLLLLRSGRQSYRGAEIHCYCCTMLCEQMWESQLLPKMGSTLNFAVVLK